MKIKRIFRLICWVRGIWRTVELNVPVSGHDFIEDYEDSKVSISVCDDCGYESKSWYGAEPPSPEYWKAIEKQRRRIKEAGK